MQTILYNFFSENEKEGEGGQWLLSLYPSKLDNKLQRQYFGQTQLAPYKISCKIKDILLITNFSME